jgi:hypothetical protein
MVALCRTAGFGKIDSGVTPSEWQVDLQPGPRLLAMNGTVIAA